MRMSSFLNIMRNAVTELFRQHLVFMVYKSSLGLAFVSLSIKRAFVNLKKKSFEMSLYQFMLTRWPHVCFFQDGCYQVISFFLYLFISLYFVEYLLW